MKVPHVDRHRLEPPHPPAGADQVLRGAKLDILKLRVLARNPPDIPTHVTVALSKDLLWRIGQAIDVGRDALLSSVMGLDLCWAWVSTMASHKMGGQQLRRLYETMKKQGYRSPGNLYEVEAELPAKAGASPRALLSPVANRLKCHPPQDAIKF